ncbi:uncharacterized protein LOC142339439 isoform X2 [Convolutriloba macropyga]|uniref:uncharacterized protein LOC142339439 isoform X2 n=1 Tax=Convolutriloba macropyga TaxID=536237 RepID=UPI003F5281A2
MEHTEFEQVQNSYGYGAPPSPLKQQMQPRTNNPAMMGVMANNQALKNQTMTQPILDQQGDQHEHSEEDTGDSEEVEIQVNPETGGQDFDSDLEHSEEEQTGTTTEEFEIPVVDVGQKNVTGHSELQMDKAMTTFNQQSSQFLLEGQRDDGMYGRLGKGMTQTGMMTGIRHQTEEELAGDIKRIQAEMFTHSGEKEERDYEYLEHKPEKLVDPKSFINLSSQLTPQEQQIVWGHILRVLDANNDFHKYIYPERILKNIFGGGAKYEDQPYIDEEEQIVDRFIASVLMSDRNIALEEFTIILDSKAFILQKLIQNMPFYYMPAKNVLEQGACSWYQLPPGSSIHISTNSSFQYSRSEAVIIKDIPYFFSAVFGGFYCKDGEHGDLVFYPGGFLANFTAEQLKQREMKPMRRALGKYSQKMICNEMTDFVRRTQLETNHKVFIGSPQHHDNLKLPFCRPKNLEFIKNENMGKLLNWPVMQYCPMDKLEGSNLKLGTWYYIDYGRVCPRACNPNERDTSKWRTYRKRQIRPRSRSRSHSRSRSRSPGKVRGIKITTAKGKDNETKNDKSKARQKKQPPFFEVVNFDYLDSELIQDRFFQERLSSIFVYDCYYQRARTVEHNENNDDKFIKLPPGFIVMGRNYGLGMMDDLALSSQDFDFTDYLNDNGMIAPRKKFSDFWNYNKLPDNKELGKIADIFHPDAGMYRLNSLIRSNGCPFPRQHQLLHREFTQHSYYDQIKKLDDNISFGHLIKTYNHEIMMPMLRKISKLAMRAPKLVQKLTKWPTVLSENDMPKKASEGHKKLYQEVCNWQLERYFISQHVLEYLMGIVYFTLYEINDWYQHYQRYFPLGFDKITFTPIVGLFYPKRISSLLVDKVYEKFVTAKYGKVFFIETVLALSVISRGTPEEEMRFYFDLYVGEYGTLSKSEALELITAVYEAKGAHCHLGESDLPENCSINFKEFLSFVENQLGMFNIQGENFVSERDREKGLIGKLKFLAEIKSSYHGYANVDEITRNEARHRKRIVVGHICEEKQVKKGEKGRSYLVDRLIVHYTKPNEVRVEDEQVLNNFTTRYVFSKKPDLKPRYNTEGGIIRTRSRGKSSSPNRNRSQGRRAVSPWRPRWYYEQRWQPTIFYNQPQNSQPSIAPGASLHDQMQAGYSPYPYRNPSRNQHNMNAAFPMAGTFQTTRYYTPNYYRSRGGGRARSPAKRRQQTPNRIKGKPQKKKSQSRSRNRRSKTKKDKSASEYGDTGKRAETADSDQPDTKKAKNKRNRKRKNKSETADINVNVDQNQVISTNPAMSSGSFSSGPATTGGIPTGNIAQTSGIPIISPMDMGGIPLTGPTQTGQTPLTNPTTQTRRTSITSQAQNSGIPMTGSAQNSGIPMTGPAQNSGIPMTGVAQNNGIPMTGPAQNSGIPMANQAHNSGIPVTRPGPPGGITANNLGQFNGMAASSNSEMTGQTTGQLQNVHQQGTQNTAGGITPLQSYSAGNINQSSTNYAAPTDLGTQRRKIITRKVVTSNVKISDSGQSDNSQMNGPGTATGSMIGAPIANHPGQGRQFLFSNANLATGDNAPNVPKRRASKRRKSSNASTASNGSATMAPQQFQSNQCQPNGTQVSTGKRRVSIQEPSGSSVNSGTPSNQALLSGPTRPRLSSSGSTGQNLAPESTSQQQPNVSLGPRQRTKSSRSSNNGNSVSGQDVGNYGVPSEQYLNGNAGRRNSQGSTGSGTASVKSHVSSKMEGEAFMDGRNQ